MRPAHERSRFIAARFRSRCSGCNAAVLAGDLVWYAKGAGVRCGTCGRHPAPYQSEPAGSATTPDTDSNEMRGGGPRARKDADGVYRYEFASLAEAVKHARHAPAASVASEELLRRQLQRGHEIDPVTGVGSGDSWTNYYDYARLEADSASPPAALLAAVDEMRQAMMDRIAPPLVTRRRLRRGRDWGDEMDVDRFLARDPNLWNRIEREHQTKRTVTIGCNLGVNAGQAPEDLLWRGAAAMALADVLTQRGLNVGIVLFASVVNPTSTVRHGVVRYQAKDPQMPLDRAGLAFAMCEIGWFRLIGAIGVSKLWPGKLSMGLGRAEKLPTADRAGMDFVVDSDVIGRTGADEWLRKAIQETGEETEHGSVPSAA